MDNGLISSLKKILKEEGRLCLIDYECVTPLYVYIM